MISKKLTNVCPLIPKCLGFCNEQNFCQNDRMTASTLIYKHFEDCSFWMKYNIPVTLFSPVAFRVSVLIPYLINVSGYNLVVVSVNAGVRLCTINSFL